LLLPRFIDILGEKAPKSRKPEENQMSTLPDTAGTIRCGSCRSRHLTRDEVLRCYVAAGRIKDVWPCSWLVEGPIPTGDPDEPYYQGIYECGAPSRMRADGTGYDCDDGHEHTDAEARQAQGWDYAADDDEARGLARNFVEPRTMAGQVWAS